jgi:hypothetical protein
MTKCLRDNHSKDSSDVLWIFMGSIFEGVLYLVICDKDTFITRFVPAPGQVNMMEKNTTQKRTIELTRSFNEVWQSLCGKSVELKTDIGTEFVAKAKFAKRGSLTTDVLIFLKNVGNGTLKECSRCYSGDWGYYFNHLGKQGQRIGMYARTVDRLVV